MFGQLLLLSFGYLSQVGFSSCNYAVYNFVPLAEGECHQINSSSSGKLTCSGTSGTVLGYTSTDCSGDSQDMSSEVVINCDNSASCSKISISGESYKTSTDCSGTSSDPFEFVVIDSVSCSAVPVGNATIYFTFGATDESLAVNLYNSTDCSGDAGSSLSFNDGCNKDGNSSSTKFTFGSGTSAADITYKTSILYVAVLFAALSTLIVAV